MSNLKSPIQMDIATTFLKLKERPIVGCGKEGADGPPTHV
jgi:hypothetical protein